MTSKALKGIGGVVLIVGALVTSMGAGSPEAPKNGKKPSGKVASKTEKILITHPSKPENYGPGTYVFEGQVGKGKRVSVTLDDGEPVKMKTDADGAYRYEAKIKEPGSHALEVRIEGEKGSDSETERLAFEVEKGAAPEKVAVKTDDVKHSAKPTKKSDDELPTNLLPEDDQSDVKYPSDPGLGTDNVPVKDNVIAEDLKKKDAAKKPTSKHDAHAKPTKPTKPSSAPKKPGVKFVISSHSNFNVVPHGVIQIGGKGKPGDKVMLLVDGKPSMKGTIKPDGRWKFPVKVASAGFRKITAQNLKTREQSTVKLKIK